MGGRRDTHRGTVGAAPCSDCAATPARWSGWLRHQQRGVSATHERRLLHGRTDQVVKVSAAQSVHLAAGHCACRREVGLVPRQVQNAERRRRVFPTQRVHLHGNVLVSARQCWVSDSAHLDCGLPLFAKPPDFSVGHAEHVFARLPFRLQHVALRPRARQRQARGPWGEPTAARRQPAAGRQTAGGMWQMVASRREPPLRRRTTHLLEDSHAHPLGHTLPAAGTHPPRR